MTMPNKFTNTSLISPFLASDFSIKDPRSIPAFYPSATTLYPTKKLKLFRCKPVTSFEDTTPKLGPERPEIYKSKEINKLFKENKTLNNFMESIISEMYTSEQLSQVTYSISIDKTIDPEVPSWKTIVLSINIKDNETLDTVSLWNELFDLCNKKIETMIKNEKNMRIKKSFQKFSNDFIIDINGE